MRGCRSPTASLTSAASSHLPHATGSERHSFAFGSHPAPQFRSGVDGVSPLLSRELKFPSSGANGLGGKREERAARLGRSKTTSSLSGETIAQKIQKSRAAAAGTMSMRGGTMSMSRH